MLTGTETGDARPLDPSTLGDHVDRLFRAAWALCGTREDAEDLVQETFARVLTKPRLLRGDDDLGYLLRVLRNTYVSRLRAEGRRVRPVPLADGLEWIEDRAAAEPHAAVETRELFAAIAALPDEFRAALVAIDVVGLSYGEAARALRVREATITTRLFRARKRIAAALDVREPAVHGAGGGSEG